MGQEYDKGSIKPSGQIIQDDAKAQWDSFESLNGKGLDNVKKPKEGETHQQKNESRILKNETKG
jgi:hypothetical protein